MRKTTTPEFFVLLQGVYASLENSDEAAAALLKHCAQLIRDPNYGPEPNDTKLAQKTLSLLAPKNRARQLGSHHGASKVRSALVEVVRPWRASRGQEGTLGWGWAALQDAVAQNDAATVRALLTADCAPAASEINEKVFMYESDGATNQTPVRTQGSITGVLMQSRNLGDRPELLGETAKALADHGVDFNRPTGPGLRLPLAYCKSPAIFQSLVQNGVDPTATDDNGVSALVMAFDGTHPAQHSNMIQSCLDMAKKNTTLASLVKSEWPALVEAWARQLANSRDNHTLNAQVSQLLEMANLVGMTLGSKRNGEPNLFASWARAKLDKINDNRQDYKSIRRFAEWSAITNGLGIPNKWTGEIEPGIPNGAWGMLVAAQSEDYRKNKSFSKEMVGVFAANHGENFWAGTMQLFKKLAWHPCTWQAVQTLNTAIPKPMLSEFRKIALRGYIQCREKTGMEDFNGFEEGAALMTVATSCLKPIAKGAREVHDPELVSLAIRAHILRGVRSNLVLEALENMASHNPDLLDRDGLRQSLDAAAEMNEPGILSRIQACVMSMETPQANRSTSRPRL